MRGGRQCSSSEGKKSGEASASTDVNDVRSLGSRDYTLSTNDLNT